jgi:hypothetical protein
MIMTCALAQLILFSAHIDLTGCGATSAQSPALQLQPARGCRAYAIAHILAQLCTARTRPRSSRYHPRKRQCSWWTTSAATANRTSADTRTCYTASCRSLGYSGAPTMARSCPSNFRAGEVTDESACTANHV